ncbi:hypothetical protein KPATCC21470_8628 [Kitasatospora purpeofusca]
MGSGGTGASWRLLEPAAAAHRPARSARSGGAERSRAQQHARAATCTRPRLTGGGRGTAGHVRRRPGGCRADDGTRRRPALV